MEHVTSRQNALVKRLREMARERSAGEVLLDGPHLLDEALASGVRLTAIAFDEEAARGRLADLAARSAASGARGITVPGSLMRALSPVAQASGVVALAALHPASLEDALRLTPQLVLVLDAVQDPGNVGAIIRAAEGCGASAVVAGPGTADPFGWKALRGSMGSAFRLPVATAPSIGDALRLARRAGIRVLATVPRDGVPLREAGLAGPAAIVLGGEGSGLSTDIVDAADEAITIEMRPPVESLNVAIAAALVLYEASRQRADVAVR